MTKKKSFDQILNEYLTYGFEPSIIKMAYDNVKGQESKLMEQIFSLQQNNKNMVEQTKPISAMDEEQLMGKAIQQSLDLAKEKKISFEPLNPEQRLRKSGVPVGLKNIGNTCYFNSLLQAYFFNVNFVKEVLSFVEPQFSKTVKDVDKQKDQDVKRQLKSIQLVKNLQVLFGGMIASDKKYLDPTSVITSIVDDYGNQIPIGDQKDIGEFNLYFLSRVEEGISLQDRYRSNKMVEENVEESLSTSKIGFIGEMREESLLRRSSFKVKQESTIGKEFFGKMETTFINEKENIRKIEEEMFTLLFVNVRYKELYRSFEEIIVSSIDDYRNQKGQIVSVEKQCWIKEPPKTLFFQIERVIFDKERLALNKIHDIFEFPKDFYIDPFLQKNKEKALKIRKSVNELRREKEMYQEALRKIQNYNNSDTSLTKILEQTVLFLEKQSGAMQVEQDSVVANPTSFPELRREIDSSKIKLFREMQRKAQQRVQMFRKKIQQIHARIEDSYKEIRTTPYRLQSILIHEGQADSGHYYSSTYDKQTKVWRKYNDLNVNEETEDQVFKEAKGINMTSAYYLVYTKEDNQYNSIGIKHRGYKLSTENDYGKDLYSQFINKSVHETILLENHQLYSDIAHFKASGFVSKVMDNYVKRFQSCNELARKLKLSQKKKNSPPVLVNFPLFVKTVTNNEQEYKTALLESAIDNYGPKDNKQTFDEVLKAKLTNLSDFKRPKNIYLVKNYFGEFLSNYKNCRLVKFIYESLKESKWRETISALLLLRNADHKAEYFNWLINVLSKILLLQLLIQAESLIGQGQQQAGLERIRTLSALYGDVSHIVEETIVVNNVIYWMTELSVEVQAEVKEEIQNVIEAVQKKKIIEKYNTYFISPDNPVFTKIDEDVNRINEQMWNFSKQEDTIIDEMLKSQESVAAKMKVANDLLKEMKKISLPLQKKEREKILKLNK